MWYDLKKLLGWVPPAEVAAVELHEAQLALLAAETAYDYATTQVEYHQARVDRLRAYIIAQGYDPASYRSVNAASLARYPEPHLLTDATSEKVSP